MSVKSIKEEDGYFNVEASLNCDSYSASSLDEVRKLIHEEIDEMLNIAFQNMLETFLYKQSKDNKAKKCSTYIGDPPGSCSTGSVCSSAITNSAMANH